MLTYLIEVSQTQPINPQESEGKNAEDLRRSLSRSVFGRLFSFRRLLGG